MHFLLSIKKSSLVGDILLGTRLFWTNNWFHLIKNIGFVNWNLKNTLVRLVFAFGNGKSKNAESQHGPFLKFQECYFTNLQKWVMFLFQRIQQQVTRTKNMFDIFWENTCHTVHLQWKVWNIEEWVTSNVFEEHWYKKPLNFCVRKIDHYRY